MGGTFFKGMLSSFRNAGSVVQNSVSILRNSKERRALILRQGAAWRRYSEFFSWFLRDSLWRFKFRVLTVTVLDFLGVTFQVLALGQAVIYAKLLKRGEVITFLQTTLDSRTSLLLLALVSMGVLGALIFSGGMIYWARKMALGIAVGYEEFIVKRTLRVFGSHLKIHPVLKNPFGNEEETIRLITSDVRVYARVTRVLMDLIEPAFSVIVYGSILLYTDLSMTVLVAMVVVVSGLAFYGLNKKGMASTYNMEASGAGSRQEKFEILNWLIYTPELISSNDPFFEKPFRSGQTKRNQEAFKERLLTLDRAIFLSSLVTAIVLCLTIVYFGARALRTGSGWEALAVYLISLRFCLRDIRNLTRRITSINRYYPIMKRLYYFLRHTSVSCTESLPKPEILPVISVGEDCLVGSQSQWCPKQGVRAAVLTVVSLNRYSLGFLIHSLVSHSSVVNDQEFIADTYFVAADSRQPAMSLKTKLRCHSKDEWNAFFDSVASDLHIRRLLEEFPFCIDITLSPKQWQSLDLSTSCAISLLAAWRSTCTWVFVEKRALDVLDLNVRSCILEWLREKVVFVFYMPKDAFEICHGEEAVIVVGDGEVIGLGEVDWAGSKRETIQSELQKLSVKYTSEVNRSDVAEMEDDI